MKLKTGVRILGVRPEVVLAMIITQDLYEDYGYEFVVTSCTDGRHRRASLHYTGCAFDCRTWELPTYGTEERRDVVADLQARLGSDFDVVDEADHLHIEFQPKEPY